MENEPIYLLPEVHVTAINPNRGNKSMHDFIMGVNSMRNEVMKNHHLNDSQWTNFAKQAVNLTGVETKNGTSFRYAVKKMMPDWLLHGALKVFRGASGPLSRGLTQIKIKPGDTRLNNEYKRHGITDKTLKESNFNQGVATMLKLLDNLKTMESNYTWKGGSPMTKEDANSIVWNRGKITSGLNDKNDLSNSASLYVKKYHDRSIM